MGVDIHDPGEQAYLKGLLFKFRRFHDSV